MGNILILIFQLIVLLFSVMIHEISHGAMANRLGDSTAKDMGRLTLNPLKHLDPVGSLLVPLSLFLISGGSFVFGWAKPVPYNPYFLKNPKRDAGLIGIAGPLANLSLALVFGILLRIIFAIGFAGEPLIIFLNIIIFVNVLLAIFNLVPIPPLDGSKVLFAFLPDSAKEINIFLERYGFFIVLIFIFFGFQLIMPIIYAIYNLIVGPLGML